MGSCLSIVDDMQAESSHAHISRDMQKFNRFIEFAAPAGKLVHVTALLDTQCHRGNWISKRLVQRLGMASLICPSFESLNMVDANGRPVSAGGVITLTWRWFPKGTRSYESQFYVLPNSDHLDVIFGVEYIEAENLLHVNESAMLPLVEDNRLDRGDMAAIAAAEARQRQEKATLEERKKQQAKEKGLASGKPRSGGAASGCLR
ncbi:hypothetical protein QBC33DRAFT_548251 [Phialemonium atrogriseum]|uniref:Uncharacterized protein n=1 Tax=Phialemonium atrogriseum TaxID=1093897 RepID=A0AAJ0BY20_9PEZI|nr:uncharacterized protein QBC33DRAFT_548251 [Phialemonium atrogriseum]KAK1764166.1 hypothetical protein QBC33DRAFT_548251 [Phialemonium atrogriseum]